jgi:membrane protease YdiL (CAAX protease family)
MNTFYFPQRGPRENFSMQIAAIFSVLFGWFIIGGFVTVAVMGINKAFFTHDLPAWASMLEQLAGFVPFVIAGLAVPLLYARRIITGISSAAKFRWGIYWRGVWTWGLLLFIGGVIGFITSPDVAVFRFNAAAFFPALLVGLLLLPLQTAAEEVFFRGVLPQFFTRLVSKPAFALTLSAALFAALHLFNPEAQATPALAFATYFAMALGWGVASYKMAGLEITLGAHLINNVSGLFIFGYDNSAVQGVALWSVPQAEMSQAFVSTALMMIVWLLMLHKLHSRD